MSGWPYGMNSWGDYGGNCRCDDCLKDEKPMPFEMNHTIAPALNRVGGDNDATELCYHAACLIDEMWDEIRRLQKIEDVARKVSETLNGGFIRCEKCGEQESTTDIDFAADLRAALGP